MVWLSKWLRPQTRKVRGKSLGMTLVMLGAIKQKLPGKSLGMTLVMLGAIKQKLPIATGRRRSLQIEHGSGRWTEDERPQLLLALMGQESLASLLVREPSHYTCCNVMVTVVLSVLPNKEAGFLAKPPIQRRRLRREEEEKKKSIASGGKPYGLPVLHFCSHWAIVARPHHHRL
eukprot:1157591-Pelagomonas_calceolata.AAC.3